MWWWRKVRKANIPQSDRDLFERYGEFVIGSILAAGLAPLAEDLHPLHGDREKQRHARDWLTERGDVQARHEQRVEAVEWAILVFVIIGVIVDVALLIRG